VFELVYMCMCVSVCVCMCVWWFDATINILGRPEVLADMGGSSPERHDIIDNLAIQSVVETDEFSQDLKLLRMVHGSIRGFLVDQYGDHDEVGSVARWIQSYARVSLLSDDNESEIQRCADMIERLGFHPIPIEDIRGMIESTARVIESLHEALGISRLKD